MTRSLDDRPPTRCRCECFTGHLRLRSTHQIHPFLLLLLTLSCIIITLIPRTEAFSVDAVGLHQRLFTSIADTIAQSPTTPTFKPIRPTASSTSHTHFATESSSTTHSHLHHAQSFTSYNTPQPVLAPNQAFLDLDNSTIVIEDLLLSHAPYSWSTTFDPASEFIVFYVNVSTSEASLTFNFGGAYKGRDVDFSYLPDIMHTNLHYQTFTIKPSQFISICSQLGPGPCPVRLTLTTGASISSLPFKLSILHSLILPWSVVVDDAVPLGQVSSWGIEISSDLLPVLFQMEPDNDPNAAPVYDDIIYLFNAEYNPIQWFKPWASGYQHAFGDEIDILMSESYAAGGNPAQYTGSATPGKGGDPYADPNYYNSPFKPSLYIMSIYANPQSRLNTSTPYQALITHNYSIEAASWNGSTYGIVSAVTLGVLCLISCSVAVIRRRCRGPGRAFEEGAFFGGAIVLTRAQRDELPQFDAQGRPIRYDNYGRVIPDLGATQAEIAALPTRTYAEGMIATEDAHCTICLSDYEVGETIKDLPCGHHFCSDCISKWLSQRKHCPNCNQQLDKATNVKQVFTDANSAEAVPLTSQQSQPPLSSAAIVVDSPDELRSVQVVNGWMGGNEDEEKSQSSRRSSHNRPPHTPNRPPMNTPSPRPNTSSTRGGGGGGGGGITPNAVQLVPMGSSRVQSDGKDQTEQEVSRSGLGSTTAASGPVTVHVKPATPNANNQ